MATCDKCKGYNAGSTIVRVLSLAKGGKCAKNKTSNCGNFARKNQNQTRMRKLIEKFKKETPRINKIVGRIFTVISCKLVAIEVVLNQYQVNVPKWFDALLIVCAIGSILVAGYNGQKTVEDA